MDIEQLYRQTRPKPVLNKRHKLAVYFNAKSGCTFLIKWFFFQIGHLRACKDYHHFPHEYRTKVYVKSKISEHSKNDFLENQGKDYLNIKVVRNPFERAVSSYIHFLGMMKKKEAPILKDFGIQEDDLKISFKEFLIMLDNLNLQSCDIHWRPQFLPIENIIKMDELLFLKDSIANLEKIEKKHNLRISGDIQSLMHSGHHSKKAAGSVDNSYVGNTKFNFDIKKERPPYKDFFDREDQDLVLKLYAIDFEKYGFHTKYID